MVRALRLTLAGALALLLAACFFSTAPLIAPGQDAKVFAGKTAYTAFKTEDDGTTWQEDRSGTIHETDAGYVMDEEEDSFVLHPAFDDYYIAQQSSKGEYFYDLVRIEGDHVYLYHFTCGDEDERHVKTGLIDAITGEGDSMRCRVSDIDKLAKVFAARLDNGARPKSLYVIK